MISCDDIVLDPAVICDEAEGLFTEGQCHTLASAISDRTGLGVYVLWRRCGGPAHAVIGLAPGLFGDVRGVQDRHTLHVLWGACDIRPWRFDADATDINDATQNFYDRFGLIKCEWEAAYAFAPTVEQLWREQLAELTSFRNPLLFGDAAAS